MGVSKEVMERLRRLEIPFNRFGVDRFGVSRKHLKHALGFLTWFYRHYFRVKVVGIDHVPPRGRAMLIGNHSGGVAIDAAMVLVSLMMEMDPPRLGHSMAEKFISQVPFLAEWTNRCGQLSGLPEHATKLLEDERLLLVFPEGAKGTAKLYRDRHSLVDFGTGFMRLALQTGTPIVPFAFLGGGEAIPTVHNAYGLGKLFGAPYVPVTPYLLALPLPARLHILYGEPLRFEGTGNEEDEVILDYVNQTKERIAELIERGRKIRRGELTGSPEASS